MAINSQQAKAELARRELSRRGISLQDKSVKDMSIGEILGKNVKGAYAESLAPVVHGINAFAFNLPRAITHKVSPQTEEAIFPEQETLEGKTLRFGSEVAGTLYNPFGGVGAIAKTPKLIKTAKGIKSGLGVALKEGAKQGALYGAAYTPTEAEIPILAPQERLAQAGIGGLFGIASTALGKGISNAVVQFRKLKVPAKAPIKQRIGWQKKDIAAKVTKSVEQIRKTNIEAHKVIDDNLKILNQNLDDAVNTGAIDIQDRLPEFFTNNSKAYGQALDDISTRLDKSGKPFTLGEASKIFENTISELDELNITEGQSRQVINNLAKKYFPQRAEGLRTKGLLDVNGNPIIEARDITGINTKINFKDFNEDIKKIGRTLSSQVKTGQRWQQEDIPYAILKKNFGEYVAQNVPDFAKLQESYKPVIDIMKVSSKEFKPYAGEVQKIGGGNLLKRVALQKAKPQEEQLISALEQGTEFAPGLGNVTSKVKKIGSELLETKKVKGELSFVSKQAQQKVKESSQNRLQQLIDRERKVSTMLENKRKAELIRNILAGVGTGTALLSGAGIGISTLIKSMTKASQAE